GSRREVVNAKEEGVEFKFNLQPLDIAVDENGKHVVLSWLKPKWGRRMPMVAAALLKWKVQSTY
ncbi:glutamate synthase subunit beta, partial [marine sediment metagenome]